MRVVYVVEDGPLQGWPTAVYRVGQDSKLWFIHLIPQTS
jgi:hypothetical protein